jgi:cysteine desulfuration protein SufE
MFRDLGLADHLTAQRSNGARSMMERIRRDAQSAVAAP